VGASGETVEVRVVERRVRAELACIVQVGTVLGENVGMENVKLT